MVKVWFDGACPLCLREIALMRRLDRLGLAQEAIEAAAKLTPTNPEVGLEAGVIAVLAGRDEAARASWQSINTSSRH